MSSSDPSLLLLVAFPLSLSAQGELPPHPWNHGDPDPCLSFEPDNTIERPPATDFGRIVIAELDGDQAPEGVVLEAGVPVAFWKLAVYDAPQVIGFPGVVPLDAVADIAALPGGGPGGTDALLMTDARGLFRVTWVPPETPSEVGAFSTPEILAAGGWIDAAPIHVDDLDLDGDLDVVGISADGLAIVTCMADGAGFEPGITVTEAVPLREVKPVDWNHDGVRELVGLATPGLIVHDRLTGDVIQIVRHTSATGCLARIGMSGGDEILAWTRRSPSGVSKLQVLDSAGSQGLWTLTFDICDQLDIDVQPTALLAADYDEDGNDELLIVHEANQTAIVLTNQGSPLYFLPDNNLALDFHPLSATPAAPGNVGIPAFGQVDGVDPDEAEPLTAGPLDLVFPVTATSRIEVVLNPGHKRALVTQEINSATIVSNRTEFGPHATEPSCELRFAFEVPTRYRRFQYLDLILWKQEGPVSSTVVSSSSLSHLEHPLYDLDPGLAHDNATQQWVHLDYAFDEELCWEGNKPCYYTEYRFRRVTSNGVVMSPIFTGGFTLESCTSPEDLDYDYLLFQSILGTSFPLRQDADLLSAPPPPGGPQGTQERNEVGLYVPMSSQPPFGGLHPSPGPRDPGSSASPFE